MISDWPKIVGSTVTAIVVLGVDIEVYWAMTLGILVGALASYATAYAIWQQTEVRFPFRKGTWF